MPQKFERTKENLDFIDRVRKALGNEHPKSFGLYVKLFKEFGREKLAKAFAIAMQKPEAYRFRYFLGVLVHEREEKKMRRRARARVRVPVPTGNSPEAMEFFKLKTKLLKKMAPPYERISRKRAGLVVKIAHEERKLRRGNKPKKHGEK